MLSLEITTEGFDTFINKLGSLTNGGLISPGTQTYVNRVRQIVIDGNPVGKEGEDEHPGLMKKSWQTPVYTKAGDTITATVINTVDYGMAENYGHTQIPGTYVPAINASLVHWWVPGTYALENSLDQAGLEFESIIRPEILKVWEDKRTSFYNLPRRELIKGADYYADTD